MRTATDMDYSEKLFEANFQAETAMNMPELLPESLILREW